ncbi:MAG: redox-sensing transcriptional repressor Rex [Longimicrobiales bacterium]
MTRLRRVVLERLIRYYRYLAELTARRSVDTITSAQLGRILDVDPSQVRKDFAAVGLAGVSRVGYDVCEVCRTIRTVLGFNNTYGAVLVGTGQLGGALMTYGGFDRYGLRIVAAFDSDPEKIGTEKGGHTIRSVHDLRSFIEEHEIPVVILTTPVDVSQGVAELAAMAGVRAIWNFSPTRLSLSEDILVRNEHISMGLAEIAFHLQSNGYDDQELPPAASLDVCCADSEEAGAANSG